jgi:hypothetical protein
MILKTKRAAEDEVIAVLAELLVHDLFRPRLKLRNRPRPRPRLINRRAGGGK